MAGDQWVRDEPTGDRLLLTPEEAAQVLRLGRTTIYALMKAGDLRRVHIGRSCRISRAELERIGQRYAGVPVALTEPLYMTNATERALIVDDATHAALALAYVRAADRYFGR